MDTANFISESSEKISQQQELSDLKLKLNSAQLTIATLELKIKQKEQIVLKTEVDSAKECDAFKLEIEKLKIQLNEKSRIIENSSVTELQDALKAAEDKASKALIELEDRLLKEQKISQVLEEYEKTLVNHVTEYNKLNDLHEAVKGNLATLETAFHDVIQKYERAKSVIEGFKANEDIFRINIDKLDNNLKMEIQRYESLKAHASKQIEKANKENAFIICQAQAQEKKQSAIIKRLQIKLGSLENSLEQKTKECIELAALCDEVTGKKM